MPAYATFLLHVVVFISAESARQSACISIALVEPRSTACCSSVCLCIKPGGRAYLRGGSESTALSSQMAVVPDHSALQQAVGRQLAIRASRAVAHHTSFLFLHNTVMRTCSQFNWYSSHHEQGSSTRAWNSFSSLCPEISYKFLKELCQ